MVDVAVLDEQVRGLVVTSEDAGYDDARTVHNAMHDRRPEVVVQAVDEADVIAAVRFARDNDVEVAVRGGGHSVPGYGVSDGGMVIDLARVRYALVDPEHRTVRIGGGSVLGDMDHATYTYGLATPAGFNSTTGIGGLTLGGGIGVYLSRRYGLTCDNLVSANVVTAEGERVTARADEHDDLFWALRGGGGNFGIVTSFELRLHELAGFFGGPVFFELDAAPDVMRAFRDHTATAPRELGGFVGFHLAPPLPFIPEERHGDSLFVAVLSWCGPQGDAEEALRPIREAGPVVAEHVGPMPYPALQSAFDPLLPPGLQHYWKSDFVAELTDDAIEVHMQHGPKVPSVHTAVHLYPVNGAVHDVEVDESAFPVRDAHFSLNIAGIWPDPDDNDVNIAWVRDYYEAIHPHSGYKGGYTNFMAGDDEDRTEDNYGPHFDRLREIKAHWDPDNVFHHNMNIPPAA